MKTIELRIDESLENTMKLFIQLYSSLKVLTKNENGLFAELDNTPLAIRKMEDEISDMMDEFSKIIGSNIFVNALDDADIRNA